MLQRNDRKVVYYVEGMRVHINEHVLSIFTNRDAIFSQQKVLSTRQEHHKLYSNYNSTAEIFAKVLAVLISVYRQAKTKVKHSPVNLYLRQLRKCLSRQAVMFSSLTYWVSY